MTPLQNLTIAQLQKKGEIKVEESLEDNHGTAGLQD